jgi:hypothetical protein
MHGCVRPVEPFPSLGAVLHGDGLAIQDRQLAQVVHGEVLRVRQLGEGVGGDAERVEVG